ATIGGTPAGGAGARARGPCTTSSASAPLNGSAPVSVSYSGTPPEERALRGAAGWPRRARSGGMYAGVAPPRAPRASSRAGAGGGGGVRRQAESEEPGASGRGVDQQVGRLDIAMHEVAEVHLVDGAGDGGADAQPLGEVEFVVAEGGEEDPARIFEHHFSAGSGDGTRRPERIEVGAEGVLASHPLQDLGRGRSRTDGQDE